MFGCANGHVWGRRGGGGGMRAPLVARLSSAATTIEVVTRQNTIGSSGLPSWPAAARALPRACCPARSELGAACVTRCANYEKTESIAVNLD